MRKKKSKLSVSLFIKNVFADTKVKIILLVSVLFSFILIIVLVFSDIKHDEFVLKTHANKYETYIDKLLLSHFSAKELKAMDSDQLKLSIDMVIDDANNKVLNAPVLKDFILPLKDSNYATEFRLSREPKTRWSQEDIDQFWIDINGLDIKKLEENNFEYLKARLKEVN